MNTNVIQSFFMQIMASYSCWNSIKAYGDENIYYKTFWMAYKKSWSSTFTDISQLIPWKHQFSTVKGLCKKEPPIQIEAEERKLGKKYGILKILNPPRSRSYLTDQAQLPDLSKFFRRQQVMRFTVKQAVHCTVHRVNAHLIRGVKLLVKLAATLRSS